MRRNDKSQHVAGDSAVLLDTCWTLITRWTPVSSFPLEYLRPGWVFWCPGWPQRRTEASERRSGPERGKPVWSRCRRGQSLLRTLPSPLGRGGWCFADSPPRCGWPAGNTGETVAPPGPSARPSSFPAPALLFWAPPSGRFSQPGFEDREMNTSIALRNV